MSRFLALIKSKVVALDTSNAVIVGERFEIGGNDTGQDDLLNVLRKIWILVQIVASLNYSAHRSNKQAETEIFSSIGAIHAAYDAAAGWWLCAFEWAAIAPGCLFPA